MSDFVDQSLLMKETDSDTYMLFSLTQENDTIVIDSNNEKNKQLINTLTQLLLNTEDIINIDFKLYYFDNIDTNERLIESFIDNIHDVNFKYTLQELTETSNFDVDMNTIFNFKPDTIYYGLFAFNNILNYFRYWMYNSVINEDNDTVLYPYGFITVSKGNDPNIQLSFKKENNYQWTSTNFFMIQNMYETNKTYGKQLCYIMLNLLVNDSYYSEHVLLLELHPNYIGNESCYIQNKFKLMKDIVSNTESVNKNTVCYNKYQVRIIERLSSGVDKVSLLAPSTTHPFALISHGGLYANEEQIKNKSSYNQYIYPFKNIHYFVQPNCSLTLGSDIDGREKTLHSVCYTLPSVPETPINNKLITLPMGFYGPREGDPASRAESFGLYDCQNRMKIKSNKDIFGENNETVREFDYIFKTLFVYCLNNNIQLNDVELKIFSCRSCCTQQNTQPIIISGGEGEQMNNNTDSISNFKPVNQSDFFHYLITNANSCDYPKKQGGKKRRKATRQHKKKSTKNKTRKHKK